MGAGGVRSVEGCGVVAVVEGSAGRIAGGSEGSGAGVPEGVEPSVSPASGAGADGCGAVSGEEADGALGCTLSELPSPSSSSSNGQAGDGGRVTVAASVLGIVAIESGAPAGARTPTEMCAAAVEGLAAAEAAPAPREPRSAVAPMMRRSRPGTPPGAE